MYMYISIITIITDQALSSRSGSPAHLTQTEYVTTALPSESQRRVWALVPV